MAGDVDPSSKYSNFVGYIFIFNLIIGAGALNLPYGSYNAGVVCLE
jgi:amino acid permease